MHIRHGRGVFAPAFICFALLGVAQSGASAAVPPDFTTCQREVSANVVVIDQPILWNRLGAANVNGMMFALKRDVVTRGVVGVSNNTPITRTALSASALKGKVQLRPDKRPRPLVLRMRKGDCLTVKLDNLLADAPNPKNLMPPQFNVFVDEQVAERRVSFHAAGLQLVNSIHDDGSNVGANVAPGNGLVTPGNSTSYKLFAQLEGVFVVTSTGAVLGADGNQGNSGNGLFGSVIVEPTGATAYNGAVTEEEMRLAAGGRLTLTGQPILDYEATYPTDVKKPTVWDREGKGGLPVLAMMCNARAAATGRCVLNEIVHSEIAAVVTGPNHDGSFPSTTYPLESTGARNPTLPNRLEPFRDFAAMFHDEVSTAQAFPGFYNDPVMGYVLAGVKDAFMINYGSGGIGSEILANRLHVGPMHDCVACAYEEFFLTSHVVGDPAMLVDVPANAGIENVTPADVASIKAGTSAFVPFLGPKATLVPYPSDPANVNHSYSGDFVKIRNTHVGKEQHIFHLHNHQWLYNPNDDNSNYLDAQGIGPGVGYTYEINFGGSGNRNKSAGDAIYHCHLYPHFAQGMWYLWRNHDVFEAGTRLKVSGASYHTKAFALYDGTPGAGARALPDGEIVAGVPIPAIVPLPGKALAPVPGRAQVVPNPATTRASLAHPVALPGATVPVGSLAKIDRTAANREGGVITGNLINPGYPFWIAGIEDTVGQRPPTPVLDMIDAALVNTLKAADPVLWAGLEAGSAGGWDGGLPRSTTRGYSSGAVTASTESPVDFSKKLIKTQAVFFPEQGTDVEQAAMRFHAVRLHPSYAVALNPATGGGFDVVAKPFITNGQPPAVGAPYHEPCADDKGVRLDGQTGNFFSGGVQANYLNWTLNDDAGWGPYATQGKSPFTATNPRIYKGANIQLDAVLNKVGYHYPQQRILTLWQDAVPVITKQQPPEPLVMRINTFDCTVYHHTNLVPESYEMDDYQVRTPTDIIGQHIHLPKWDLTTTDGSGNGWNYEDGTLSPGAVRERIEAFNNYLQETAGRQHLAAKGSGGMLTPGLLAPKPHPYFDAVAPTPLKPLWMGARTTIQRWFADPVVNHNGIDRGLGIIFTHDHYGPSTHQQIGLYATVLIEPAGSKWVHNETGVQMATRADGGPTSWQAAILPNGIGGYSDNVGSAAQSDYREFYFEFTDFQHAYEKGVYVGADELGVPLGETVVGTPTPGFLKVNPGAPQGGPAAMNQTFRWAINPPARQQITPLYPDLVVEVPGGVIPGCPTRPCPQAISVSDPGVMVVNYRNEPVGLRVFDPAKPGPDGKPGMQADGIAGDLAFALASQLKSGSGPAGTVTPITRKIPELNKTESTLNFWNGKTLNAPTATLGGDPFTPMMRAYAGDLVRVKMQAGGQEEEHNASILGLKWLQAGSGYGKAPNSGWRNSQAIGISEQFTLAVPMHPGTQTVKGPRDYVYTIDSSMDGWWSGTWGLLRSYDKLQADLVTLPGNTNVKPDRVTNKADFNNVCPILAPLKQFNVIAILANQLLPKPAGVTIVPAGSAMQHVGGLLDPNGGTLVYNPRTTAIPLVTLPADGGGTITVGGHAAPLHDPTAMLYVRDTDLMPVNAAASACTDTASTPGVANASCPVQLKSGVKVEPLMLRANAGDCVEVTLFNRLPALAPDLPGLGTLQGVVKRDRKRTEGSVPFDNNLIRASSHVGIVPQLVAVDVELYLGLNVGTNFTQTVPPVTGGTTAKGLFRWYAGDLSWSSTSISAITLTPTPIEFGGFGLSPTDRVKQGQKSLVGGMVVLPPGATVTVDAITRAQATVTAGGKTFRDFMLVMTKDQNHRYADGAAVEHMNGEGAGIPEDSQENSAAALNYGIEPLWLRLGIAPNAPFGGAGCGAGCFGSLANMGDAFSNSRVGGFDPVTPVFTAKRLQEARMHVVVPHSTSRGTSMAVHGHVWQRDPYLAAAVDADGMPVGDGGIGSVKIGRNPLGFAQGGQESLTSGAHFTFRLPKAGGEFGVTGDYLFQDMASFGLASGLWGILRVQP